MTAAASYTADAVLTQWSFPHVLTHIAQTVCADTV